MNIVNCNADVIKPKQSFLLWVNGLPDQDLANSLEEMRTDCTVLLIPEFATESEAMSYIESIYEGLFEMELESWCRDEALWPRQRSVGTFRKWFQVEIHSEVLDLLDEEIEKELL